MLELESSIFLFTCRATFFARLLISVPLFVLVCRQDGDDACGEENMALGALSFKDFYLAALSGFLVRCGSF